MYHSSWYHGPIMSPQLEIRHGLVTEREDIYDLVRSVHGDTQDLDPSECIVASYDGKIVGCVRVKYMSDGTAVLASLGVHPKYRRYGIGSQMIQKLLQTHTARPLYVLCFPELEEFYRKSGFEKIAGSDLPLILQTEYEKHTKRTRQDVLCMVIRDLGM